jgi:hypothetical protein
MLLNRKEKIKIVLVFAIITWVAHFWYFREFGLYEDDYAFIGGPMNMNFSEFSAFFKHMNLSFFQGRIVGVDILLLSAYFVGHWGGLSAIYVVAYLLALTNNLLFLIFLKHIWNKVFFVVCGSLAFILFPADNTRAFLTHIHILPSITFLLLAFISYFNKKKILSYPLIAASFMSYETCFLLFLTAPFFVDNSRSKLGKEFIKHTFILAILFLSIVAIRKLTGESRIQDLDTITALLASIRQTFIGPFVCIGTFFYRPWQVLKSLQGERVIFVFSAFIMLYWLFIQLWKYQSRKLPEVERVVHVSSLAPLLTIKKLSLLGTALLFLSYPLIFTTPATLIDGRASRVHTASAIGASILWGILCYLIVNFANSYRQKKLIFSLLAGYFSLLIGFGLIVQQHNQLSWKYQQAFWKDIIELVPDLSDGQVILVNSPNLAWGSQLNPFDWSMPSVLSQIYRFPPQWKTVPKLYKLNSDWQNKILSNGKVELNNNNGLLFFYYPWESPRSVKTSEIILLQEKNGKLTRQTEPLLLNNQKISFKPLMKSTLNSFEKGYLYNYLIAPYNREDINYFKAF